MYVLAQLLYYRTIVFQPTGLPSYFVISNFYIIHVLAQLLYYRTIVLSQAPIVLCYNIT